MSALGPYEFGQVHCVRCLDGLAQLPDACIDMIIGECPTNDITFFEPCVRVLKGTGAFYVRSELDDDSWVEKWTKRIEDSGLVVVHKVKTTDFNSSRDFDCFLIATKEGHPPLRSGHRFRASPPPLEFIHPRVPDDGRINRAQRDVETYVDLIRLSTDEGNVVLDICAGSGASGVACIQAGRRYLGFENCSITTRKASERLMSLDWANVTECTEEIEAGEASHG